MKTVIAMVAAFVQAFISKYLAGYDPAHNNAVAQYAAQAAEVVIEIVEAAASSTALDEAAMHNKAVADLKAAMESHTHVIPADLESALAEAIVAAAEAELRKRGGSFFGGLQRTLNEKLNA